MIHLNDEKENLVDAQGIRSRCNGEISSCFQRTDYRAAFEHISLQLIRKNNTRQQIIILQLSLHLYSYIPYYFEVDRGVDFGHLYALLCAQAFRHLESLRNQQETGTSYHKQRRQYGGQEAAALSDSLY